MSDRQRHIEKIRKLMALAAQTNSKQEAANAIAKAQAWMHKYGITEYEVTPGGKQAVVSKNLDSARQRAKEANDWLQQMSTLKRPTQFAHHARVTWYRKPEARLAVMALLLMLILIGALAFANDEPLLADETSALQPNAVRNTGPPALTPPLAHYRYG